MRVAIVHEWLAQARGAERVLDAMCEAYPQADLFTLLDCGEPMPGVVRDRRIVTSYLQHLPRKERIYRHLLPLMPMAIESFDLRAYDLVISSHFCVAKGVLTRPDAVHVAYVHTPPRYVWEEFEMFFGRHRVGALTNLIGRATAHYVRTWDEASAARPDVYLANSHTIAERVWKRYRRRAEVVHPPVELQRFDPRPASARDYYLAVGGLVPQKRVDLAVHACNMLGRRLIVVGAGPEDRRLRDLAGPTIEFAGRPSDEELANLMEGARALLFPAFEDFGIVMVESLAAGRPVVAYGRGGSRDILADLDASDAPTGVLFGEQSAPDLARAIMRFERAETRFDPELLRNRAAEFGRDRFIDALRGRVEEALGAPASEHQATRGVHLG